MKRPIKPGDQVNAECVITLQEDNTWALEYVIESGDHYWFEGMEAYGITNDPSTNSPYWEKDEEE